MSFCYINGFYKNNIDALISVEDRGFNFSDGVYEVIFEKAYDDDSLEEFPKSISEVLENHELEYSSCEEDVSPDYYYELNNLYLLLAL